MRSRRFICVKGVRGCFPDKVFVGFRAKRKSAENASRTLDALLATDVSLVPQRFKPERESAETLLV